MASPSAAPRPRPRRSPEPDDLLLARAAEWTDWARRNAKLVIGVTVAVLLVVGALLWYRIDQARKAELAAIAYAGVQATAASGNQQLAARDLQRFVDQYGSTPEGAEARIALAQLHLTRGEPRRALPVLQPAAGDLDKPLGTQAALLLGAAQEQAGDRPGALATYLRVADGADAQLERDEALRRAANLREMTGEYTGAAELYRRLVEGAEEGSFERSLYEMRLAEVEGRARAK